MTIPVTLNTVGNLQDTTTAQTVLNANNVLVETGFSTALNVTGDQMKGNLDMNSNQILNLPSPGSANSPVRLQDVTSSTQIASVPPVGTSGAVVPFLNGNNTWSGTNTFSTITGSNMPLTNINNTFKGTQSFTTIVATTITTGTFISSGSTQLTNPIVLGYIPWVDARAYGVTSSNPDNASSFNAALTWINSNLGGGVLFVPQGTYYVSSTIVISNSVIVQGQGRTITNITATSNINPVSFSASTNNAAIRDLEVIGYQNAAATQPAVNISAGAVLCEILNCDCEYGSAGLSTQGVDCNLVQSTFFGYTSSLMSSGTGASWYQRCSFDNALSSPYMVNLSQTSAAGTENHFVMCDFSGNASTSLYISDSGTPNSKSIFDGCIFSSPIQINNAGWVSINNAEIGHTTFTISGSSVVTVVGSYGFASTAISSTSSATKIVTGCYQIT